ncbi:PREDICTED: peptidyl-alpha-hydroxyglycine alpha-amidating lyase 1-like [Papilio polytes]|uniref:peptidyl-alpha-hydroxyglycine alpha-amidating lyase 1-like n=1 Tax=Papilio polytes TaxID=76194 RepID=UPI00067637CA|nr:PREDICTED: peptidyl-alpha-hydroxyglycine alpha-amidating lyase 1-like [Papilio polytes]
MKSLSCTGVSNVVNIVLVLVLNFIYTSARRVPVNDYYGLYEHHQPQFAAAIEKLEHEPKWVENWPDASITMGQVSGVALDNSGLLLVFHRGPNIWGASTFSDRNVYNGIGEKPIPEPTILVINDTGELVDKWGKNLFYMPHGITVDAVGNVWLTDVALHQVFKFTPDQRDKPAMVLGEKFVPGDDESHFCKPSAVAVMSSGEFFVADGYCNTRIIKFAPDGTRILQWGKRYGDSPFVFKVPHALALAEERGAVCAADRERGRVACFRADNGTYLAAYSSWLIGDRLFSVAYAPVHGGRLYVVNGPSGGAPVRGYVLEYESGRLVGTFAPAGKFSNPHDVAVSADGARLFVPELDPYRVCKFVDDTPRNASDTAPRAKPTATVEMSGSSAVSMGAVGTWGAVSGAMGAALGAVGAALLALGALALLRARNRGKEVEAEPLVQ